MRFASSWFVLLVVLATSSIVIFITMSSIPDFVNDFDPNTPCSSSQANERDKVRNEQEEILQRIHEQEQRKREQARLRMQKHRLQLSDEEKKQQAEKAKIRRKEKRDHLTPEEHRTQNQTAKHTMQCYRGNLTPEEQQNQNETSKQLMQQYRDNLTPEQRQMELENLKTRMQQHRASLTPEQRTVQKQNDRKRKTKKNDERRLIGIALRPVNEMVDEQFTLGPMDKVCRHCGARHFAFERIDGPADRPEYRNCCQKGRIKLEQYPEPPDEIKQLLVGHSEESRNFKKMIRAYNNALAFTSTGVSVDKSFANGSKGVYTYRFHGALYHNIGSLLPKDNDKPAFCQIYVHDTANELNNRLDVMGSLNRDVLRRLQEMMHRVNPYAEVFRNTADVLETQPSVSLRVNIHSDISNTDPRRYNRPTSNEVAALVVGDGTENVDRRDIVLRKTGDGSLQRINEASSAYEPLHYVLLFPYGTAGWCPWLIDDKGKKITLLAFADYRLAIRDDASIPHEFGRLFHEYTVDTWARIDQERLNYVRNNQKKLRAEVYQGVADAQQTDGDLQGKDIGRRIVLPATHIGGPRYMQQLFQDAIATVRVFGKPDLFITVTCNPNWPEIKDALRPGESPNDRPDLIAKVFCGKLTQLMHDIQSNGIFSAEDGKSYSVNAMIHTIEFQKRGLPHAHILVILDAKDKPRNPDQYNAFVSAEIPDQFVTDENGEQHESKLYKTVCRHQIHGPCGNLNPNSPCMDENGRCTKRYPREFCDTTTSDEDGYPKYRRRETECTVEIRGFEVDNRWVVPYNPHLSYKYDCHINVEICSSIKCVKYLYKYVYKGPDRAVINVSSEACENQIDEIKRYLDCRYFSASEACWRILHYTMHSQRPTVVRLQVHLPNEQMVYFGEEDDLQAIVDNDPPKTTLTAWFEKNQDSEEGRNLLYHEFPRYFVYDAPKSPKKWKARERCSPGGPVIGRIYTVHPSEQERFYLRLLLLHVAGAKSYEDLRTGDDGVIHATFREAAKAMGLVDDDKQWFNTMTEASSLKSGNQLRRLFATILLFGTPVDPAPLFAQFEYELSEDFLHREQLTEVTDHIRHKTLHDIERTLKTQNKTIADFPNLPIPPPVVENEIIEYNIDPNELENRIGMLNEEQREAFEIVTTSLDSRMASIYFLDAPGGTGKTFVINVLLDYARLHGMRSIAVATSGIAALILHGGRTAHSQLKIPIVDLSSMSRCAVSKQTKLADDLRNAIFIVWDETTMANKLHLNCVDATLRDLCNVDEPFGGKVVLFAGDFRQVLPVIRRGERARIVGSCIKRWNDWPKIRQLTLITNMRVQKQYDDFNRAAEFASWLLRIGEGKEELFSTPASDQNVRLPAAMCVQSLDELVDEIFPDVNNARLHVTRAIVAPKNDHVDFINAVVLQKVHGKAFTYKSVDSVDDDQAALYPPEFLNSLCPSGMPPHRLILKANCPVIMMRNLDPKNGLCNGTRLLCKAFKKNVIEAECITGTHVGKLVFIPRISLTPSDSGLPFVLRRKQFPIKLCYGMTINKSQSQTLDYVGLYLPEPPFAHGQLYVALSRVGHENKIKIYTPEKDEKDMFSTRNVVYTEVID